MQGRVDKALIHGALLRFRFRGKGKTRLGLRIFEDLRGCVFAGGRAVLEAVTWNA
jgi:hypothetical protein